MKQALVASALIAGVTASASASLFAQNPNGSNGLFADSTGDAPLQQIADDFVLTANATVGAVTFWGGYFNDNNAYADDFTVKIYEDSAGEPGAELLSTTLSNLVRTDTGTDLFGVDEYRYEADLTTVFNATAGVSYF
ncbi:MAG: hypothetical protein MK097_21705, partial [Dechloromonas sp.]|nr:hypothetical protein [Dechloromonas sp.]